MSVIRLAVVFSLLLRFLCCAGCRASLSWPLAAALFFTGMLACWMRLNGIFTVIPTLFLLIFLIPGKKKWGLAAGLVLILLIYSIGGQLLKPELCSYEKGIRLRGLIQRNQAQQVMRCVIDHGDELTAEQIEIIDAVMDYEKIPELYSPGNTDPVDIVRRETTNEAIANFQKLWSELLFQYPATFVQAFLNKSYGYFSASGLGYLNLYCNEIQPDPRLELEKVFPQSMLDQLWEKTDRFRTLPLLIYFSTAGLYTQIAVICGWLLLRKREWTALLPVLPFAITFLVCMAGPLARVLRYALPMACGMPLLAAWVAAVLRRQILNSKHS